MNPSDIQSIPLRIVTAPQMKASATDLAAIPPTTFVRQAGLRGLQANAYIRASQPAQQRNITANTGGTTGNTPSLVGQPGSSGTPGGTTAATTLQPVSTATSITMPPRYTTGNRTSPGRRKPSIWKTVAIAGGVALLVVMVVT